MDQGFVLELLPARGLDQSMLLPVLIGLLVVLFFTEVFGWVFAGAVVPGYLASVLVIQPVTGAIVIFESLTTLVIAAGLAKLLSRTDVWTRFFGRERFFLILVVSLIVRIHDQAWFAPWMINWIDYQFDTTLEITQEFYSVGLVLVPLTANMLWKPAPHRGLMQLVVEVGITYLVVAYILLPYTNLSLSSVELTYENTAINFVAHAKAHIILLSAALLAAQFNLTYGWDFNGIMVPALLALLWLTPLKLVATLVEAVAVLYMVRGFLKLPVIQHMDFEGPRKIVLVFTMAFIWKMALGYTLGPLFPDLKVSDAYGFGYLLSSLLAVKMLSKKSVRAVMLPSLTASSGGFVIGSVIGFVLELLVPGVPEARALAAVDSHRLSRTPLGTMTLARMRAGSWIEDPPLPTQAELGYQQEFWRLAADWVEDPPPRPSVADLDGSAYTSALALRVWSLGPVPVGRVPQLGSVDERPTREWFAVIEQGEEELRGWPAAILAPGASGPVLVVPMPASEAPTAEAAAVVCRAVDCRAILVSGREQLLPGTSVSPRPLEKAMDAFAPTPTIVLRIDTQAEVRDAAELLACVDGLDDLPGQECPAPDVARATVHPLRGTYSIGAPWPSYQVDWSPRETVIRPPMGEGLFAVMRVGKAALEARVVTGLGEFAVAGSEVGERVESETAGGETGSETGNEIDSETGNEIDSETGSDTTEIGDTGDTGGRGDEGGPLRADDLMAELGRMHDNREPPGMAGAGYLAPSPAELRVLEELVVEPLVAWAESPRAAEPAPPAIATWASLIDYELIELGRCEPVEGEPVAAAAGDDQVTAEGTTAGAPATTPCMIMLRERARPITSGWGTLVLRRGPQSSMVIEIPRPNRERDSWRVGAELWQISPSRALLIAGADGRPDNPLAQDDEGEAPAREAVDAGEDEAAARRRRALALGPDPVLPGNLETPFQAMHQGIERVLSTADEMPLIQIRGIASYRALARDVIVGVGQPSLDAKIDEACLQDLVEPLRTMAASWGGCQTADGSEDLYLLSGAGIPQLEYSRELGDGRELRVLWLSAAVRARFATDASRGELGGLSQVGIPYQAGGEIDKLLAPLWQPDPAAGGSQAGLEGFERAVALAVGYAETTNLHQLRALRDLDLEAGDLQIEAGVGLDWGRPYLLVEYSGDSLGRRALISLEHRLSGVVVTSMIDLQAEADPRAQLRAAAMSRPQTIELRDVPVLPRPEVFP